jgi:hypothetical protein
LANVALRILNRWPSRPYDVCFKSECAKVFPPEVDFNQPVPRVTAIFEEILAR